MPKLAVLDMSGKNVGSIELSPEVFEVPYNEAIIHQITVGLQANLRHGTSCTKTRGEVRGGGRKPWRQKGTGMARHGSRRSPIWKGGGTTFGPRPRKYTQKLPKNMRHLALRSALSQRVREEMLTPISAITMSEFKTKTFAKFLADIKVETTPVKQTAKKGEKKNLPVPNALIVLDGMDEKVQKSAANLPNVRVAQVANLNLLDVVLSKRLVFTQAALEKIQEVLKP